MQTIIKGYSFVWFFFLHADNLPVVGLEVDHGEGQCGSWARYVHVDRVTLLDNELSFVYLTLKIMACISLISTLIW